MNNRRIIKNLVLTTLLITLGQALNRFIPMVGLSIRPDFSLVFLFICIAIEPTFKQAFIASLFTVIIAIFFGLSPLLQIPSFIDRFGSAIFVLMILKSFKLLKGKYSKVSLSVLFCLGTVVSGILYISSCIVLSTLIGIPEMAMVLQIGMLPLIIVVGGSAVLNLFFSFAMLGILTKVSRTQLIATLS